MLATAGPPYRRDGLEPPAARRGSRRGGDSRPLLKTRAALPVASVDRPTLTTLPNSVSGRAGLAFGAACRSLSSAGPEASEKLHARPALAVSRAMGAVGMTPHGHLGASEGAALEDVCVDLIEDQGNLKVVVDARDVDRLDSSTLEGTGRRRGCRSTAGRRIDHCGSHRGGCLCSTRRRPRQRHHFRPGNASATT
jgi:hypothetical protein